MKDDDVDSEKRPCYIFCIFHVKHPRGKVVVEFEYMQKEFLLARL